MLGGSGMISISVFGNLRSDNRTARVAMVSYRSSVEGKGRETVKNFANAGEAYPYNDLAVNSLAATFPTDKGAGHTSQL